MGADLYLLFLAATVLLSNLVVIFIRESVRLEAAQKT